MKKIDLTDEVKSLHQSEIMDMLESQVMDELKEGDLSQLKDELSSLLKQSKKVSDHNVVPLVTKKRPQMSFESVELLAAAGVESHDWYSAPIKFAENGFILEVRKVLGSEDEVEITLKVDESSSGEMKSSFSSYKNKSLNIVIQSNQSDLLEGEIYVDSTGEEASGSGKLLNMDKELTIKNSLVLTILE